MQDVTDSNVRCNSKKFWKIIRPYCDKGYNQTDIRIGEKNSIITDKKKLQF